MAQPELSLMGTDDAEWRTRCDLAALYRIIDLLGWTDLIYTHLSARIPGRPGHFLINRYGELFEEVTASSLVKVDFDGNVVGAAGRFNPAGFNIHSGAYMARPDIACVIHLHTKAAIAVAAQKDGLLPISQHSLMVLGVLGYHDYDGPGVLEERDAVGRDCVGRELLLLRNHGLLGMGATLPAAFKRIYYLQRACEIQIDALAGGRALELIPEDVQQATFKLWRERFATGVQGEVEWETMLRKLDRDGADYRR